MLTSTNFSDISDQITLLYSELEFEIESAMFKRICRLQKVTDSTIWQAQILRETGGLRNDIKKILAKFDPMAQKQLKQLFYSAMKAATENDIKYYKMAMRKMSESQRQRAETALNRFGNADVINKTYERLRPQFESLKDSVIRMTLTVADASEKQFLTACNAAFMKVNSGAFSWQQAQKDAVNAQARAAYSEQWAAEIKNAFKGEAEKIADEGIKTVIYTYSGKIKQYSIEAATRMNIITGINQAASQQTLQNMLELGADLVEVSAHYGARDKDIDGRQWANHAALQGRIYCTNGERDYIDGDGNTQHAPNFETSCGLGEPDGICGINCRHSFYPYIEGTPAHYDADDLDNINNKTVTLEGREVPQYEAEQELRKTERAIRTYKARAQALELTDNTGDAEYIKAKEKIYIWQQKARDITEETGLKRHYINEYIGTKDGEQPRGIKPKSDKK